VAVSLLKKPDCHALKAGLAMTKTKSMKYIIFLLLVLPLVGCSVATHGSELMALKSMATDETVLAKQVKTEDAYFQKMLQAYKADQLAGYTHKKQFAKDFGQPIFKRPYSKDEQLEEWLYRYSTQFMHSPKIYVYFDKKGQKADLHYEPGKSENPPQHSPASP
jgi:outer membrane protein assembly factor BamE (lipoprotein component of BamABCDE complex)